MISSYGPTFRTPRSHTTINTFSNLRAEAGIKAALGSVSVLRWLWVWKRFVKLYRERFPRRPDTDLVRDWGRWLEGFDIDAEREAHKKPEKEDPLEQLPETD